MQSNSMELLNILFPQPGIPTYLNIFRQGLIQKEKVHIDCEKGAQINILASKTATK